MPSLIFWPSSLAAPLNGAEIPNRISLSVTPRKVLRGSCGFGESDACCVSALADGVATGPAATTACCACALAGGAPPGSAAVPVARTGELFAGALFAASRSEVLELGDV